MVQQGLAFPVRLNSLRDLKHNREKNIKTWGPKSLHLTFGPGSFLCTIVIPFGEQRKSTLLPQMRKETHNCNRSNWIISLNLKKAGRNHKRIEDNRPDPADCTQISFYPSLQKSGFQGNHWDSQGGGVHGNGELRRWGRPDYYLLHSLN